MLISNVTALPL